MELEEIVPVLTANPPKRLEVDEHSAITQIY